MVKTKINNDDAKQAFKQTKKKQKIRKFKKKCSLN